MLGPAFHCEWFILNLNVLLAMKAELFQSNYQTKQTSNPSGGQPQTSVVRRQWSDLSSQTSRDKCVQEEEGGSGQTAEVRVPAADPAADDGAASHQPQQEPPAGDRRAGPQRGEVSQQQQEPHASSLALGQSVRDSFKTSVEASVTSPIPGDLSCTEGPFLQGSVRL